MPLSSGHEACAQGAGEAGHRSGGASPDPRFVGRLAPTPSGRLHLGNLFSFLIAELMARRAGGVMRMRVEDLDPARSKPEFADAILRDLERLGFAWEGPIVYQSARTEAYREAFARLDAAGLIYPCFCTRADLHAADAPHFGEEVVYAGTCRHLSAAERLARSQMRAPAQRVIVPDATITFEDAFQGICSYNLTESSGDFIVQRSDRVFAYQLAVTVDDAAMGVTSVVRGVDLLSSTPRQLFLQEALGYPHPTYAHVPLLTDRTGRRLAKRHHDANVGHLLDEAGWTPDEVLGHVAWRAGLIEEEAPCSLDELVRYADLGALKGCQRIVEDEGEACVGDGSAPRSAATPRK